MPTAADYPPHIALPADVGGHRLVRVLGRDSQSLTALVHADGESRVARVLEPVAPLDQVEQQLAVYDRLAAAPAELRQHVVALDDLFTLPDGRLVLLFPIVPGPRVSEVLASRAGRVEAGEAVTILAPLVDALERAHELGITGLGLEPATIRFAASGAPVILDLADALAGPPLPARFRDEEPAYRADQRALAALGARVAAAVVAAERVPFASVVQGARADRATMIALFDLAAPIPVRAEELAVSAAREAPLTDAAVPEAVPENGSVVGPGPGPDHGARRTSAASALESALTALALPAAVVAAVIHPVDHILQRATRMLSLGRTVRPRVIVAGAAGLAALVVSMALVAAPAPSADADVSDVGAPGGIGVEDAAIEPPFPSGPRAVPETLQRPLPEEWDPLVRVLLERWVACRAAQAGDSPATVAADPNECAAAVAHPGSAAAALLAHDDPRHALLEDWLAGAGEALVAERMGAAVLVDLVDQQVQTTTASLLLIRSEAGWRVRDVVG